MTRVLASLLVLAGAAAVLWFAMGRPGAGPRPGDGSQGPAPEAYDFQAEDVVLRQMDATGRLLYEVNAKHIVQLADGGTIQASDLTLHHDPRGTPPAGPGRWTLTAGQGELPPEGDVVTLSGGVVAKGVPKGRAAPLQLTSDSLRYNLVSEEFSSEAQVEIVTGRYRARGGLLRGNVATNEWALESGVHGTISRQD